MDCQNSAPSPYKLELHFAKSLLFLDDSSFEDSDYFQYILGPVALFCCLKCFTLVSFLTCPKVYLKALKYA